MEIDLPGNDACASQETPLPVLSEIFQDKEMDVKCSEPIQLIRKAKVKKRNQRNARKIAIAENSRPQQNPHSSSLTKVQKFLAYISQEYEKGTIKIYPSAIGMTENIERILIYFNMGIQFQQTTFICSSHFKSTYRKFKKSF